MVLRPVSLAMCDCFATQKFVSTSGSSVSTLTALPEFQTFEEMAIKILICSAVWEAYTRRRMKLDVDSQLMHSVATT